MNDDHDEQREDHLDDPGWQEQVEREHGELVPYSHDQLLAVVRRMRRFGSGFEVALAHTLLRADEERQVRLRRAFPEHYEKFERGPEP